MCESESAGGPHEYPALRTIQRIVQDAQSFIQSARAGDNRAWSLLETDPDAVALIMPVIAAVSEAAGRATSLFQAEGDAIVRVRRAAPTLPPYHAFLVAELYLLHAKSGSSAVDLDLFLACRPWENPQARQRYDSLRRQPVDDISSALIRRLISTEPDTRDIETEGMGIEIPMTTEETLWVNFRAMDEGRTVKEVLVDMLRQTLHELEDPERMKAYRAWEQANRGRLEALTGGA